MSRPNQQLTSRINQRTLLKRVGAIAMVLASTVVWYQNSPLRGDKDKSRSIRVQKEATLSSSAITQKSGAQQRLPMIRQSLQALQQLKNPTNRQRQRIRWWENQQKKARQLADYELRLSLHETDSSTKRMRGIKRKIQALRTEIANDQMP